MSKKSNHIKSNHMLFFILLHKIIKKEGEDFMCTAINVTVCDNYFGRNLDYEYTFGEKITIMPRNYEFTFTNGEKTDNHYAIIGMALIEEGYPLYFDATNEKGLSMAGLNFPDNAVYMKHKENKNNIASFEFIPWILTKCHTVDDAKSLIEKTNISDTPFSEKLKPSPLHWIVSDKNKSITVEQTKNGMNVFENKVEVLTNNPTFDIQLFNLQNYMSVTNEEAKNNFSDKISLKPSSRGMGGIGLPGDLSSQSRFVRACFTKLNSVWTSNEYEIVNQFFHILYSVYQQKGCVKLNDKYEITNYSSCCNTDKGIYYYTTYNNFTINAVNMRNENLNTEKLITYDLISENKINMQN